MKPPARLQRLLTINAYWIGLSFMWNGLHQLILPTVLLNFVDPSKKNTYLGLLTFVGLVIATIVQPIAGSLSDRWTSRWGRRRPLMLLGTSGDFIFLALLAWSGGLVWVVIGYIGLQFTSNVAHGPCQGLMPDQVPHEQLGAGSGIKNLMDMAGLVIAMLFLGRVLGPEAQNLAIAVALVAGTLAIGALVTILGVRETPTVKLTEGEKPSPEIAGTEEPPALIYPHQIRSYWWLIGSRFLFLLGIYDIQGFVNYYIRDVMNVENPVKLTGDLLAIITLALMAFAIGGGWAGDRFGHKRLQAVACVVGAVGCLLLLGARTPVTLLAFGSVLGAAIGLFLTSNWAMANKLSPASEAGKYLGLSNLATAGAGALARLAGPAIDLLNNTYSGMWYGYTAMFIFGAFATLGSAVVLRRVLIPQRAVISKQ